MAKKANLDEQRLALKLKLEKFDGNSPVGTYQIDNLLSRLCAVRSRKLELKQARRWVWRTAYLAFLAEHHDRVEHPNFLSATKEFERLLRSIVGGVAALHEIDVEALRRIYVHLPIDPMNAVPPHEQPDKIEVEVELIRSKLVAAANAISNFLEENIVPDFDRSGNAADLFVRNLIDLTYSSSWKQIFGSQPVKADRRDFVALVATVLADCGYPESVRQSDDKWLYDRIAKQIVWK